MHPDYHIRHYDSSSATESASCLALEDAATQGGRVLRVSFPHKGNFVDKSRQFPAYSILVAVQGSPGSNGPVVGVVAGAVTEGYVNAAPTQVGYVFDLRVHPDHCRKGLARGLMDALEDDLETKHGVEYIYLTVNRRNEAARALYAQRGYAVISQRALTFRPLFFPYLARIVGRGHVDDPRVQRVDAAQYASLYRAAFGEGRPDLALVDPTGIVESPFFLQGFAINDPTSRSSAALALWNGNGLTSVVVRRFIVPDTVWASPLFRGFLAAVYLSIWILIGQSLGYDSWVKVVFWMLTFLTHAIGALFVYFLLRIARNPAWRARLILPIASGPRGDDLLKILVAHGKAQAEALGFAVVIVNSPPNSLLWRAVDGTSRIATLFMARHRGGAQTDGDADADADADADNTFFDPRII